MARHRIIALRTSIDRLFGRVGKNWIIEFFPDKIVCTNGMGYTLPPIKVSTGVEPSKLVDMFMRRDPCDFERYNDDEEVAVVEAPVEDPRDKDLYTALKADILRRIDAGLHKRAIVDELGAMKQYTYRQVTDCFERFIAMGFVTVSGSATRPKYTLTTEGYKYVPSHSNKISDEPGKSQGASEDNKQ